MYTKITNTNTPCLQMVIVAHKAQCSDEEARAGLDSGLDIVLRAPGIIKVWRGTKYEERQVFVLLIMWENHLASLNFYTSKEYEFVYEAWRPFLAGRELFTKRHVLVHDVRQLERAIATKSIEVAMTRVKPGKVADYYGALMKTVHGVLTHDPGCDGYYINSTLEDPDWQVYPYMFANEMFLINWKSVDAHNVDFVKNPGFADCISALWDCYYSLPTPWHIMDLKLVHQCQ